MRRSIAVVGAGPAGLYAADALARKVAGARIDVLDRLPTPFGLARGGVAPDHQGTKAVTRQFERTLGRDGVRFLGNVELGRDVGAEELAAACDAVLVAVGACVDRRLGIPGEDLHGVSGSFRFVGWYNGHPDHRDANPRLDVPALAIIGNGNVAIDCARILAKTAEELAGSDLCAHAAAALEASAVRDIYLIGRRGPLDASFTPLELAELGELARCAPVVDRAALPPDAAAAPERDRASREKIPALLRGFASRRAGDKPVRLHFLFNLAPVAVIGDGAATGLRLERTRTEAGRAVPAGERLDLPVGAVISAIGYRCAPVPGLPFDTARGIVANDDGRIGPGLYAAGWCRRGSQGVIPANRVDALAVADLMAADLAAAPGGKPGPEVLGGLLAARGARPVSFTDWQRIGAAEIARAAPGRPREKFTRIEEILGILTE